MKRTTLAAAIAALAVGVPLGALGQTTAPARSAADSKPSATSPAATAPATTPIAGPAVTVNVVSMTGKVTAIDPAQRRVAVKGSDGRMATLVVGPNVRNFDNLKLGDEVTMRYTEAHSLAIAKGGIGTDEAKLGEIRTKVEADAARQAAPGGKPGFSAMERSTLVANVFEIDRERGILTLRGTDGVPVDIKVPEQALDDIKLDDQLVIGYRQAAAVSIEPGGAGDAGSAPGAPTTGTPPPAR